MTPPTLGEASPGRARSLLTLAVELVAVLGALGGLLIWLGVLPSGDAASDNPTPGPPVTSPAVIASAAGSTAPVVNPQASVGSIPVQAPGLFYLDRLGPIVGGSRRVAVPKALADDPAMARAIAIKCPTNQSTDRAAEITYELRRKFGTFTTTIVAYRDPAERVAVEVSAFREDADRLPGSALPEPDKTVRLEMGTSLPFSLDVSTAYHLRLQVVCEQPGGVVVFAGAGLTE